MLRLLKECRPVQLVCPPWLETPLIEDVLDLGRGWSRLVIDGYPLSGGWKEAASALGIPYYPTGGRLADGRTWALADVTAHLLRRAPTGAWPTTPAELAIVRGDGHTAEEQMQALAQSCSLVYVGIKPLGSHWEKRRPQIVAYDPPLSPSSPLGPRSRLSALSY